MKNATIWLIRHGITEGVKNRWIYGQTDLPLTEEGIEDIKKLVAEGIYPSSEGRDMYSSGLTRANQTLSAIYGDAPFSVESGFGEMGVGKFECRRHEEVAEDEDYLAWLSDRTGDYVVPGGESLNSFAQRVEKALTALIERTERDAVIVCHGGTISAIMGKHFKREDGSFFLWVPKPGHGYALEVRENKIVDMTEF